MKGTIITAKDFIDTYENIDKCAYTDKVKSVVIIEDYNNPFDNNVNIITNPCENIKHSELKSGKELRRERRKNERKNK